MTTTKAKRFNKDGVEIEDVGPLKDGERRSFPMSMMDSAHAQHLEDKTLPIGDTSLVRHTRGFIGVETPVVDTTEFSNAAEASYAERKQRLSQAWLYQQPKPAAPPLAKKDEATTTPATDTESLLQARDERLTEAWRTPAPLPASSTTTDTSTTPPVLPDAAAANAAREAHLARVENAWRAA
jgi:hypothetical protein